MEVCKSKSFSPHNKRSYKTTQTRPTNSPRSQLEERSGIQSFPTAYHKNQTIRLATIHIQRQNSTELIRELKQTPVTPTSRFASLDITNMYSNIPIKETKQLLNNILASNMIDHKISSEILNCYEVITTQNYFAYGDRIITQTDGLAVGAPSSGIISGIFLQHFEHAHFPILAHKHKLVNYFRYVDDVLLIYDDLQTDIHTTLSDFNSFHPNPQLTKETEHDNKLNYLDITIHKTPTSVNIGVFRKPTFTDTIIPYTRTSNHPPQQKYAAIRFLYNRLKSYQLQDTEYQQE